MVTLLRLSPLCTLMVLSSWWSATCWLIQEYSVSVPVAGDLARCVDYYRFALLTLLVRCAIRASSSPGQAAG